MVKKTPQSSLKNRQNDLYVNSRANLGSNSEILIQAGDIATNRGYSHQTRIAKIGALLKEGQDTFTAGEKQYAQLLLNNSQSYLQNQAEKGRIKNYSIVKDNISTLKNSIRTSPEYKQVIPITYTPSPVETIEIRKPASQLENVVKAEFTPITTPANVTPVSFLGRTGKSLARFAAIGTLAAVTTFYGLLGVSCHDRKEAKIAQLQTEKVNLEEERTKLSGSLVSANINYDRATNDLANLQGQYTDATNTSHNLSTNLTALTKEHSLATNDLAGVRRDHGNATNALDKAEVKLTELQADLGSSRLRNVQMTNEVGSAKLQSLVFSNQLHTATNDLAGVRRDHGNATNQVTELRGYLSTAKNDLTGEREQAKTTIGQLEKERKAHGETGNQLTRTRAQLESAIRDYNTTLAKNSTLSRNLTTSARELAVANSTLQDRLREVNTLRSNLTALTGKYSASTNQAYTLSTNLTETAKNLAGTQVALVATRDNLDKTQKGFRLLSLEHFDATNRLALTRRQLAEATGKYNAMAHLQGETAFKLSTTSSNLANTSNNLALLTGNYRVATNDLTSARRELKKHADLQEMERAKETRRMEDGRIVDKLMSVGQIEFPLSIAKFNKNGKRLENIQAVPYYGDKFVDTFPELISFASAIGNTFTSTSHVHDAVLPDWFGGVKLSANQTRRVLEQVPRSDLLSLGGFLEATRTNNGIINFTGKDGNNYILAPSRKLNNILGAKK